MSPASQGGGLEVKRYIGSCLISGAARGPPLLPLPLVPVGVAGPGGGGGAGAFSRLAAHTQGAPLILAGRYGARKPAQGQRGPRKQQSEVETRPARGGGGTPVPPPRQEAPSTASDESSGPADSCLPRIIKPRKRRKKDRKPATATEASNIVTLKPYVPLCYDGGGRRRIQPPEAAPPPEAESRCQCRLCDPARIWDAAPEALDPSPFASIPLFLSAPAGGDADTDDGFFSDELPTAPAAALRRSWSSSSASSDASSGRAPALEVSTEIVTSPNGHRDIEIKFYSSSPPSGAAGEEDAGGAVYEDEAWSESASAGRSDVWDSEDDVERFLGESLWANIEEPDADH